MKQLTDPNIIKKLFYAYLRTSIVTSIAFAANSIVCGMLSSRFMGSTAIAAIGVGSPIFTIIAFAAGMIGMGCQTECAKHVGRGEKEEANIIYSTSVMAVIAAGAFVSLVCLLFSKQIVIGLGADASDAALVKSAEQYLTAVAMAAAPIMLADIFTPALLLEGRGRAVRILTLFLVAVNIAGVILNVFVLHGGVLGMGIASAAANYITIALTAIVRAKTGDYFRFSIRYCHPSRVAALLYHGAAKAVRRICNIIRPIILNRLVVSLAGVSGLAALSVQNNFGSLVQAIPVGISMTVFALSGVLYAEKSRTEIAEVFKTSLMSILLIAVPTAIILVIIAPVIANVYIDDSEEVEAMACSALRWYCAAIPFMTVNEIYTSYYQSIDKIKIASILSVFGRIGFIALFAFALSRIMGIQGVWVAAFVAEVVMTAVTLAYVLVRNRKGRLIERAMDLPEGFGSDPEDVFEAYVTDRSETLAVAEGVKKFLRNRGSLIIRSDAFSLFVLALLDSLVSRGFDDGRKHMIYVKVVRFEEGGATLRLRDNCRKFDAVEWYRLNRLEGLRDDAVKVTMRMASEVKYSSAFGSNDTFVKFERSKALADYMKKADK